MELILSVIGAVLFHLIASEIYARLPSISAKLVITAANKLPNPLRDRYKEEWLAHLRECSGNLRKVSHALECFVGARVLSKQVSEKNLRDAAKAEIDGKTVELDPSTACVVFQKIAYIFDKKEPEMAIAAREFIKHLEANYPIGDPNPAKLKELAILVCKAADAIQGTTVFDKPINSSHEEEPY